jgi:hypothetical protein
MWFDSGIIGVLFYYGALIKIYFESFKASPIVLGFAVSIFFNSIYESWMVASLNPFTIMFLLILTIFGQNMRGAEAKVKELEEDVLNEKEFANA